MQTWEGGLQGSQHLSILWGNLCAQGLRASQKVLGDPTKWENEAGGAAGAHHTGRLVWATSAPRASFTRWNEQLPSQLLGNYLQIAFGEVLISRKKNL